MLKWKTSLLVKYATVHVIAGAVKPLEDYTQAQAMTETETTSNFYTKAFRSGLVCVGKSGVIILRSS